MSWSKRRALAKAKHMKTFSYAPVPDNCPCCDRLMPHHPIAPAEDANCTGLRWPGNLVVNGQENTLLLTCSAYCAREYRRLLFQWKTERDSYYPRLRPRPPGEMTYSERCYHYPERGLL